MQSLITSISPPSAALSTQQQDVARRLSRSGSSLRTNSSIYTRFFLLQVVKSVSVECFLFSVVPLNGSLF